MSTVPANEVKKEVTIKCKAYYIKGADMRWSFQTLEDLAIERGAKLENGDVLIIDNEKGDKRKAFKKTKSGAMIIYAKLLKDVFTELQKVTNQKNFLEAFNYDK